MPADAYKHTVACFHLQDQGAERIIRDNANVKTLRAEKIKANLQKGAKQCAECGEPFATGHGGSS